MIFKKILLLTVFIPGLLCSLENAPILVLLGKPGAGKGTVGARLSKQYGLKRISSGEFLLDHIAKKTKFGLLVQPYIEKGDMPPDELVVEAFFEYFKSLEFYQGCILDGFPRTVTQAQLLDEKLYRARADLMSFDYARQSKIEANLPNEEDHSQKEKADEEDRFGKVAASQNPSNLPAGGIKHHAQIIVFFLDVSDDVVLKRIEKRLICQDCMHPYHPIFMPSLQENQCDHCKGPLYRRVDDAIESITRRLVVYQEKTAPVVNYYRTSQRLFTIEADNTPDSIYENILEKIDF